MLSRPARGRNVAHRSQNSRRLLLHDDATSPAPHSLQNLTCGLCAKRQNQVFEPLWWAEALLAKQEAYTSVETVNPPARQWQYKPVGGRLLSKLATATNERLASDIHRPSMDGSRLDFEALSLGW